MTDQATHGVCRIYRNETVLTITTDHGLPRKNGTQPQKVSVYLVTDLHPDKRIADPAYRLQKLTGDRECYEIHRDEWGFHCSCPDRIFRGERSGMRCKHLRAMIAAKLLPGET